MGILGSIFGFISKPLEIVLAKVLPDKAARDAAVHELEMELLKLPFEERMAFEKRVLAEMQHPNWLRDAVRPIITYCSWFTYMFIKGVVIYSLSRIYIPAMLKVEPTISNLGVISNMLEDFVSQIFTSADFYILMGILSFWFGSKAFERVVDKFAQTGGIKNIFFGKKNGKDNGGNDGES